MAAICRKCGSELSIFQSDLCSACRTEQDRQEDHQKRQTHALEMAASVQRDVAFEAMDRQRKWDEKIKKDQQAMEEQEKRRQQWG